MGYDIRISAPRRRALFELRGDAGALAAHVRGEVTGWPARPCRLVRQGGVALMWLGPQRWWLMGPPEAEAELAAVLMAEGSGHEAAITLISDTQAFFALSGRDAGVAMAIACPLDLHAAVFGAEHVAQTNAFGVRALVLREGADWVLAVEPSFATYVEMQLRGII